MQYYMRPGVCYVLKNYSKIKISSIGASTVREISTVSCALAQFSVQRLSISAWDILPSKKNPKKPKNKKNAKGKLPRSAGKPRTPATLKSPATLRQHRTIPALRLKHRSDSCGTASALPKCSIMSGCGARIVLRGQKPLALCDRCPCFGSLFPPLAALTFAASSIICAFGLASAAPRSPYRHLELCGIALKIQAACREFSPSVCTGARQVLYCLQNPCERK